RLDPAPGPPEAGPPALDRGDAAVAHRPARRLPLPAALPARLRPVRDRARARGARWRRAPPRPLLARPGEQARGARPDDPRGVGRRMSAFGEPLVEVEDLVTHFPIREGLLGRQVAAVHAVDGVTFSVREGETLRLVGESGCGKSTLGRTIVRLLEPTSGDVRFQGRSIAHLRARELRPLRREMQMVFQDPYASLNPRKRIGSIIASPMKIHGAADARERRRRVQDLLDVVGLSPEHYNRYPHEFS